MSGLRRRGAVEIFVACKRQIETKWGKVCDQLHHDLVASMRKRCIAVLEAAGEL